MLTTLSVDIYYLIENNVFNIFFEVSQTYRKSIGNQKIRS